MERHAETSAADDSAECEVCGDKSATKHYGVHACESCRLFFKRSIRKHIYYSCRFNTGLCTVDKQCRNICQFCRMKRCLDVGMREEDLPDLKSLERRRRAQQLARLDLHDHHEYRHSTVKSLSPEPTRYHISAKELSKTAYPVIPCSRVSLDIRRDMVGSRRDTVGGCSSPEHFIETASRWLFMSIKWAKSLPYFAELYYPDQLELLRQNWSKLFLFNLMYFEMVPCMTKDDSSKVYKEIFARWSQNNLRPEIPGKFDHSLEKMRRLEMDETETLLIKSLLLFNPDTEGLVDASQVQVTQNKCHRALEEHASSNNPRERDRSGRILLIILTLSTFEERDIESIFLSTVLGNATVTSLMENILCADAM